MQDAEEASRPGHSSLRKMKDEAADGQTHKTTDKPYRELIGSLLYMANWSRPDISFIVGKLSTYNDCAKEVHWKAALHILRYLKGTLDLALIYGLGEERKLNVYSDSDFGTDLDTRRSISGTLIKFNGGPVAWRSVE